MPLLSPDFRVLLIYIIWYFRDMKKFLILLLVSFHSLVLAEEFNYQKVFEVPEKSAEDIKNAFGEVRFVVEETKMNKFSNALDLLASGGANSKKSTNTGKIVCNIGVKWLPKVTKILMVILFLKQKKVVTDYICKYDNRSGIAFNKLAKHAQEACIIDIENWAEAKFNQVKAFDSDW